jgi:diamine N-acetyltransferase
MTLHLVPLSVQNLPAALDVGVAPHQREFVAPVAHSLAEAYVNAATAWPRLVLDGDDAVGFVMAGFDPDSEVEAFRAGVWRLNVAAHAQGRGVGRYAVDAVAGEARSRGFPRISVLWKRGEGGPEGFYLKCGFVPTGEEIGGQVVGRLELS